MCYLIPPSCKLIHAHEPPPTTLPSSLTPHTERLERIFGFRLSRFNLCRGLEFICICTLRVKLAFVFMYVSVVSILCVCVHFACVHGAFRTLLSYITASHADPGQACVVAYAPRTRCSLAETFCGQSRRTFLIELHIIMGRDDSVRIPTNHGNTHTRTHT